MSSELPLETTSDLDETAHDSKMHHEMHHDKVERRYDDSQQQAQVSTAANYGTVDEICTCVGFLTCQDPENYPVDDDDDDDIVHVPSHTPTPPVALPDPPQPDPPESHTVLVQRTRSNENEFGAESTVFDDEVSSRAPIESFDVIVHVPSRLPQYNDNNIIINNNDSDENVSTETSTTTSTTRRKKPEEYEPLILIVDDEETGDHAPLVSPTSNCAVRDTSSTSSLQYHRRSPMFLSYASPQQEQKQHDRYDGGKESTYSPMTTSHHKQRHDMFQSLLQHELSKRNGRRGNTSNCKNNTTSAYSIQYNRYSTSKHHRRSIEDTIRRYSDTMRQATSKTDILHNTDQYLYPHKSTPSRNFSNQYPDTSTIATSATDCEMDPFVRHLSRAKVDQLGMNDTDTVRAVAPDKVRLHHPDPDRHHHHHNRNEIRDDDDIRLRQVSPKNHYIPADQVIVVIPHSNATKLS